MASFSEVFLFFCEGPHDSAFLSLLLRKALGVDRQNLVVSDLPYPFSNIIKKSMESRAAEDLRLDLAKKFFLPDFVHARGEKLILIFNSGGKIAASNQCFHFLRASLTSCLLEVLLVVGRVAVLYLVFGALFLWMLTLMGQV